MDTAFITAGMTVAVLLLVVPALDARAAMPAGQSLRFFRIRTELTHSGRAENHLLRIRFEGVKFSMC